MPSYNHLCLLAFTVHSNQEDGEDITEDALFDAIYARLNDYKQTNLLREICLPPQDTFMEKDDD